MADPEPLLARTRLAIANILLADGVGIALSGLILRNHRPPGGLGDPVRIQQLAYLVLFALILASTWVRLSGRRRRDQDAFADPAERFLRDRSASAIVAGLAIPVGFAYGWLVEPRLEAVGPFWVVALALGARAFPWRRDLPDFPGGAAQPPPDESSR